MDISQAIRFLRKKKGWTQQQLADFSHTSKSNISNLENGNQGYSPAILQYLSEAFECPVSQIFRLAEELEKQQHNTHFTPEDLPIELLMLQLPPSTQAVIKTLVLEYIKIQNNSGDN
ncbi:helix-turn-helix domain-containing protein [Neisseria animalis]|uniref:XRE family transcriptional regulator n=1 Tax=Neisseria animalis TaxID=492 RepID=A0A5P3MS57_NEIAN|nr:helix-turn-helix transcriptional regulator [Neisseria animalis]QEY24447.1 XRE family transcriptional regulator [Neisseria animalis]ROW31921.1 XRE family transcriptional regulator [Neisseria animalis]VEE07084.1 anaerobic benzoate catabolism transcriptional regulator [Neisseria animalis]